MKLHWLVVAAVALAGCHAHTVGSGAKETPPPAPHVESPRPVRATPSGLFKPGGIQRLQAALKVPQTGKLDEKTRQAILAFQKSHDLPATGLPDYGTVHALGLHANDVFVHEKAQR